MKKLSKTNAKLKNRVRYKKACIQIRGPLKVANGLREIFPLGISSVYVICVIYM